MDVEDLAEIEDQAHTVAPRVTGRPAGAEARTNDDQARGLVIWWSEPASIR
jgi:hypothetical protein